jgi:hypothetical protein
MERICSRIGIDYKSGTDRSYRSKTANGPSVSIDDVVLFLAQKMPAAYIRGRGSKIAPSTFGNHRSWHLCAKACLTNLEGKDLTNDLHARSLGLVKQLVLTGLTELDLLQPRVHGSWDAFTNRVTMLEGISN